MLSTRRGTCPRSESLLARRVRLRRRRRPRMPPPLPSRSARRDARVHCRRRACGDAAFCGAIRRGGSSALSSSRSGEWTRRYLLPSAWHARLSLGDALPAGPRRSPLPRRRPDERCWCSLRRALWRRVRPPARRTACARMPETICGRAQSCRRRQYPGAALLPRLSWLLALPLRCPRAARRAGDTIAARAPAAGARHHPASLRGGRRALACVCGCATLEGAGGAAATAIALLERALRRGCLSGAPTRASPSVPGKSLARGASLPLARRPPLCGAFARRRRCRLTPRNVPPGLARRRHALQRCGGLQCDPPRWQRAPPVPAPGDWT